MNKIIKKFPHRSPSRIVGEPTYQSINGLLKQLYANAAAIPSTLGGGKHGHVGLLMTPTLYATLSSTEYRAPSNPGPTPVYPVRITAAEKYTLDAEHLKASTAFETHTDVSDAIKQQIVDCVEETYLHAIEDNITGLMGISPRKIIQHLLKRYGRITPAEMKKNYMKMNEPMDPNDPIDIYFKRVEDCVQYADAGKCAFTPEQIILIVYIALQTSGVYEDACKEWRKRQSKIKIGQL